MLQQKDFYNIIESLGGTTQMKSKFRQVGDVVEAGYLPNNSGGTCSYTTLDFHRAVSQGCEQQWMDTAGQAKKSSSLWQATLGDRGNNFGRRQQMHYTSPDEAVKDPLYLRSLPGESRDALDGSIIQNSRLKIGVVECFNPADLVPQINSVLSRDPQASIRLSFDVIEKGKNNVGHTIGICSSRDGQSLYVMDPNVGVIATNQRELPFVLDALRSALYKDYTLGNTTVEVQDKFWLDPRRPLSDGDVQRFRAEETSLLTTCTEDIYKAYQKKQFEAPIVDDCAFDEVEVDVKPGAPIIAQPAVEAVFDDAAWADDLQVNISAAAVAIGAHEYHESMRELRAHTPLPAAPPPTPEPVVQNPDDEWDVVNNFH